MAQLQLFHISEQADIRVFKPRPSPSYFEDIKGDVVFAITAPLLHNYLVPRDCPRVTYYKNTGTTATDIATFFTDPAVDHVVVVEEGWYPRILETTLYCYEFPTAGFQLLDAGAGYYISYEETIPLTISPINDIPAEMRRRKVELRLQPSIRELADAVKQSSMSYSLIRMRNAGKSGYL